MSVGDVLNTRNTSFICGSNNTRNMAFTETAKWSGTRGNKFVSIVASNRCLLLPACAEWLDHGMCACYSLAQ